MRVAQVVPIESSLYWNAFGVPCLQFTHLLREPWLFRRVPHALMVPLRHRIEVLTALTYCMRVEYLFLVWLTSVEDSPNLTEEDKHATQESDESDNSPSLDFYMWAYTEMCIYLVTGRVLLGLDRTCKSANICLPLAWSRVSCILRPSLHVPLASISTYSSCVAF